MSTAGLYGLNLRIQFAEQSYLTSRPVDYKQSKTEINRGNRHMRSPEPPVLRVPPPLDPIHDAPWNYSKSKLK